MFEHGDTTQADQGEDAEVLTPLGPAASGPTSDLAELREIRDSLAGILPPTISDTQRIERIRALEELKSAAAAQQARLTDAFNTSQRDAQVAAGAPKRWLGRGIGEQIAAARRDAPRKGARHLTLAQALVWTLPHTMRALELGLLSERRAGLILREIACLSTEDQREVDRRIAADTEATRDWGDKRFTGEARDHAHDLDHEAAAERARKAISGRRVTLNGAPRGMSYLTGLLPAAQGIAVYRALQTHADSLRAAGDDRTRGQIMADTLTERVTGQSPSAPVPVEIRLVITDRTLLAGGTEPAYLPGYGSIPAATARAMARDAIRYQHRHDTDHSAGSSEATTARGRGGHPPDNVTNQTEPAARRKTRDDHEPSQHEPDPQAPDTGQTEPDQNETSQKRRERKKAYAWLRGVYTHPNTGALIAMSSKRRTAPPGLADLIDTRDQTCRTPWCDAPIRHRDHITPHANGGPTQGQQMQGLCEACNYTKEAHGWSARRVPGLRHTVQTTTPTGHEYTSRAPRLPGAPPDTALVDYSYIEGILIDLAA